MREIPGGFRHETADMYFPCLLKVSDIDQTEIVMQDSELAACEWIEFKDIRHTQFYISANQIMHSCILDHVQDNGELSVIADQEQRSTHSVQDWYEMQIEGLKTQGLFLTKNEANKSQHRLVNNIYTRYKTNL